MATRKAEDIPPTLGKEPVPSSDHQLLFQLYEQVCETWRDVSDTRFKLLGLLPVGTVRSLILLFAAENISPPTEGMESVGGLLITFGLSIYEWNNDTNRKQLFERGRRIEFELGIKHGVFMKGERGAGGQEAKKPGGVGSKLMSHGSALTIIYATCITAWLLALLISMQVVYAGGA